MVTPGLPIDTEDPLGGRTYVPIPSTSLPPSAHAHSYFRKEQPTNSGASDASFLQRPPKSKTSSLLRRAREAKIQYKTNIGSDEPRIPPSSRESLSPLLLLFLLPRRVSLAKVIFLWASGISLSAVLWYERAMIDASTGTSIYSYS